MPCGSVSCKEPEVTLPIVSAASPPPVPLVLMAVSSFTLQACLHIPTLLYLRL